MIQLIFREKDAFPVLVKSNPANNFSNLRWFIFVVKCSRLVWFSLHSCSLHSHCPKSPLRGFLFKGFLILFSNLPSFVIPILTFRCPLLKFNPPVKFIWFRYTPQYARKEAERVFREAIATFVGKKTLAWVATCHWQAWCWKGGSVYYCHLAVCQVGSHIVASQ